MTPAESVTKSETTGSAALWFGILAGPFAWGIQILVGYNLEEIVCAESSRSQDLLGIGIETVILCLHVILIAITIAGVVASFRCWRRTVTGDGSVGGRASWMAVSGMMVSILFLIVIASGFFPTFFLDTCDAAL
jgi:hypothetical protein